MRFLGSVVLLALLGGARCGWAQAAVPVSEWVTDAGRTQLLARQPAGAAFGSIAPAAPGTIEVNDATTYQTMDGFGFAMTGGSAQMLHRMSPARRAELLREIFGHGPGDLGVSVLRLSMGASDMNDHVFTYDDVPAGETDPTLKRFSLAEEDVDLVPVMQEILRIAPGIRIMATPWTAPSWMKTNGAAKGGHLRPELRVVYATYFVKYLQGMRAKGIPVWALTMQNEPLNPKNTPSMVMEPAEEDAFLRDALGPALRSAGLATKVILFDHNCNHPDYPEAILSDPSARDFADGSAFHLYEGDVSAMSALHTAFPAKNVYFTEQMVIERRGPGPIEPVAVPVSRVVIGASRNWARTVLLWNLAADPSFGPHTPDGGCPVCQGAITVHGDEVTRNIAFYTIAHVSKFVPPGSVRVDSTETDADLANVAWRTPEGGHVLLVTNTGAETRKFTVGWGGRQMAAELAAGSVASFAW